MQVLMTMPNANDLYRGDNPADLFNKMIERAAFSAQIRAGSVTVGLLDLAVSIIFASPLTDANYIVLLQPLSGLSASLWPSAQTGNGFTLNLSVGVVATIGYAAIGIP